MLQFERYKERTPEYLTASCGINRRRSTGDHLSAALARVGHT